MNFTNALGLLLQGKKMRRSHWHKPFFIKMNHKGQILEMNTQNNFPLKYQSTQGTDWEVLEEPKEFNYPITCVDTTFKDNLKDILYTMLTEMYYRSPDILRLMLNKLDKTFK